MPGLILLVPLIAGIIDQVHQMPRHPRPAPVAVIERWWAFERPIDSITLVAPR